MRPAVLCVLLIAACSSPSPQPATATPGEIQIAVDAPLSGADAAFGTPMLNGVRFAVDRKPTVHGFRLSVLPLDDSRNGVHDAQQGAGNVMAAVENAHVLGLIGPIHSTLAKAEIPVAARGGLPMVSPGATDECLTKDLPYCAGLARALRAAQPNVFFRLGPTNDLQGPAMADFMLDTLKLDHAAVASDNQLYGKTLADNFRAELKRRGGVAVTSYDYDPTTTIDFTPFLRLARDAGAQAVYFGGVTATRGCQMRGQMKGLFGMDTPFLSDDGIIEDPQCVTDAGAYASGIYASVAGIEPASEPRAMTVVSSFRKLFPRPEDYGQYTIAAVSATDILVAAIGHAIDDAGGKLPTREQVRSELERTKDFPTPFGPVSFDEAGDGSLRVVSIYECRSTDPKKEWPFVTALRL